MLGLVHASINYKSGFRSILWAQRRDMHWWSTTTYQKIICQLFLNSLMGSIPCSALFSNSSSQWSSCIYFLQLWLVLSSLPQWIRDFLRCFSGWQWPFFALIGYKFQTLDPTTRPTWDIGVSLAVTMRHQHSKHHQVCFWNWMMQYSHVSNL